MPLYEYRCESCDHQFEVIQKFSDAPIAVCPKCGQGPVVKLMSSPAFQFKGSGWYITDYARKDKAKGDGKSGGADKTASTEKSSESKDAASPSTTSSTTPAKAD
jgi:putative FmdB family regulatory protein